MGHGWKMEPVVCYSTNLSLERGNQPSRGRRPRSSRSERRMTKPGNTSPPSSAWSARTSTDFSTVESVDDILVRGSTRSRAEPDPVQRNPTQPPPQVGQGFDFGRSDRRPRHNGFLAVRDTSMHLTTILTPGDSHGKRRCGDDQSPSTPFLYRSQPGIIQSLSIEQPNGGLRLPGHALKA
jgi:hypothetical protein